MSRPWRVLFICTFASVLVVLVVMLLIKLTPQPPVIAMEKARHAISSAGKNKASTYSRKLYDEAENMYDSAMANWLRENERFLYARDYKNVAIFAELAEKKANEAELNAFASRSTLEYKLEQKIDSLNHLISEINQLFYSYPLTDEIRDRISKGKLLLKEAEIANSEKQYLMANLKINDADYLLTASFTNLSENLSAYFSSFPIWTRWIEQTISDSKKNKAYAIIIDKYSRKCLVYLNGIEKYEFIAELGKNWVGDKKTKGDKATPEGLYKISKKLDGANTRYYKALLINYPNDEDKKKFQNDYINGYLPSSATIGNLIEIHGDGGKGVDWTDGCIALTNREMDILFRLVKVDTPVTIVGSTVNLQKVINR